jgi:hypothetical protein
MRHRITDRAAARALVGLPTVAALALMLLNDHLLKGWFPSWLTGKLSDFAFLFFAPIVLVFATRARTRPTMLACYAAPTALFVAINLSHTASTAFADLLGLVVPTQLWPDPTDLIALVIVPVSLAYLSSQRDDAEIRQSIQMIVTGTAAFACMATSPRRYTPPPTHQPVYMSWDEFRSSAVEVSAPRPIETRGKIVIAHDHLFISEPGRGVHVFDNRTPQRPRPVMFIAIPGNIDISVHGDALYADSFVDLLTFSLDLEAGDATLVARLEDQFDYDPHQALQPDAGIFLEPVDQKQGVVIGAAPLGRNAQGGVR